MLDTSKSVDVLAFTDNLPAQGAALALHNKKRAISSDPEAAMFTAILVLTLAHYPAGPIEIGPAGDPQMKKGTVVSAGNGSLVMKDNKGKDQSYSVDSATKITVNGKPGRLEDLQETMPVQVTTDEKGKLLAISTIDMEKRPGLVILTVDRPSPIPDRLREIAAYSKR